MKKFSFRLESLLQHRKLLEDRERTTLSQARSELISENDRQDELQRRRRSTFETIIDADSGRIDGLDLELGRRYLERVGTEIAGSKKRLETLDRVVQAQTQVVVEASKRTKVLDTLKTKKKKEHRLAADKAEQKDVDEVVVLRHPRRESN